MANDSQAEMPFLAHVAELRRRLLVSLLALVAGFAVAYATYNWYFPLLVRPLGELAALKLLQLFLLKLKVSLYGGIVLTLPIHVFNVVAFVRPALKPRERRLLGWALGATFALALAGALMAYGYVVPWGVRFLRGEGLNPTHVPLLVDIDDAVSLMFHVILAFVLVFQLPLLLEGLMAFNLVTRRALLGASRYIIVLIFVIAAVVTPPDVISMVSLAVPLTLLFFLSILLAKILRFGEERAD
jgi:sec-independent protein translocase protein TatC